MMVLKLVEKQLENGATNILFFLNPINKNVKPIIKGGVHYDEKYVKVKGDDNFDLNAVDSITKFVLAHSFVVVRTKKACI